MAREDRLAEFPTTHATYLTACLDDGGDCALRDAGVHLMARYARPLAAYARASRLARVDEPDELVHGFLAARVGDARFLGEWRASGMPLRRWMLNGLLFHARGVVRYRAREAARRGEGGDGRGGRFDYGALVDREAPDAERAFERAWAFALVEAACRAAAASLESEGRGRAYACFHRHFFDGAGYAEIAAEIGADARTVASEIRLATRRARAEAEAMLRDELGAADPAAIAAELGRIRALTGWPA